MCLGLSKYGLALTGRLPTGAWLCDCVQALFGILCSWFGLQACIVHTSASVQQAYNCSVCLQVLVFLLVLIAFSSTVGALGLGFASSLSSPGKTILVMNLVLLLGVLFGGFLANKDSIPVWLRWISWLSVFRWVVV